MRTANQKIRKRLQAVLDSELAKFAQETNQDVDIQTEPMSCGNKEVPENVTDKEDQIS